MLVISAPLPLDEVPPVIFALLNVISDDAYEFITVLDDTRANRGVDCEVGVSVYLPDKVTTFSTELKETPLSIVHLLLP